MLLLSHHNTTIQKGSAFSYEDYNTRTANNKHK